MILLQRKLTFWKNTSQSSKKNYSFIKSVSKRTIIFLIYLLSLENADTHITSFKELERKPNKKKDMELGYVFNGPVKILKN